MKLLAILSSMPFESDRILAALKKPRTVKIAGKNLHRGKLSDIEIILMNTGIGKVNAAHAASCILERYSVDALINIGVAGAYSGAGLKNGDIAVASKEILGDEGVVDSRGWKSLSTIGIPVVQHGGKKYFNEFQIEHRLFKKIIKAIAADAAQPRIGHGPFVTLSAASGSRARAGEFAKRFNAICENMEGAAVAQVSALYKMPFLEIRGISNIAGVRDKKKWDLKTASENCQDAVMDIIRHIF